MARYVEEQLIRELSDEAVRQLKNFRKTDTKRQMKDLAKKALGRYVAKKDDIYWPAGLLLLGLVEAGRHEDAAEYIAEWIRDGSDTAYVDDALTGYVIIRLYEITGKKEYRDAADKIAEFLKTTPRDIEGSIIYGPGRNEYIYADGAGMTALFLSHYGKVFEKEEASALAKKQIGNYLNYGMAVNQGLPYHGYDVKSGVRYGIIGWGRAAGWLLMGMAGYLSDWSDPGVARAAAGIVGQIYGYLRKDHLFSWQLEAVEGPSDTSATGMLLWSVAKLEEKGVLPGFDHNVLQDSADSLRHEINGGRVYGASAECIDFAQYKQEYGSFPWGQGAVLAFLGILK